MIPTLPEKEGQYEEKRLEDRNNTPPPPYKEEMGENSKQEGKEVSRRKLSVDPEDVTNWANEYTYSSIREIDGLPNRKVGSESWGM